MTIQTHLQIVGVLLILLGGANVLLPRYFDWKRDLMAAPLFTRRVFWVHLAFLVLTLELFGWATLVNAGALLEPGPLSRAMLAGMALFWWVRFLFQFFVYESELWRGDRFRTRVHYGISVFWLYLAGTYSLALWRVWG
jgi:hypothetical protein